MAVKRKYRLNLRNYGNLPAIMLSQYDEGYALEFEIRDGTDAASDLSAYTVTLKGTRADTLAYSFAGTVSTNVLTFVIDTTMTACAGRGTAEIAIKDTANDVLFATFNMPVFVERAAVPEGSIDADVERAQEIAEQVQEIVDNAAAAVSGEAEKWATGQIDGTDVPSTDPAYENNAKYYAEQAETAAESIGIDETLTQAGKAADSKKTGDEIAALKEGLQDIPTVKTPEETEADLYICDASGNVIGKFENGNIMTKMFDSSKVPSVSHTDADGEFFLSDENGNAICVIENGNIKTKRFNSLSENPNIVTVKKDGTGDYTTLRSAVESIVDADPINNPYVIEVYEGVYDVCSEYTQAEIESAGEAHYTDTSFVGLKLTNGISMRGVGRRDNIILNGYLDPAIYIQNNRNNIATLNIQGESSLENLTVIGENIRYAVHDDFRDTFRIEHGRNPKRIIKNCIFVAKATTGGASYGAGTSAARDYRFKDCEFIGGGCGIHTVGGMPHSGTFLFENCRGVGLSIGDFSTSSADAIHLMIVNNCDFDIMTIYKNSGTYNGQHIKMCGTGSYLSFVDVPTGFVYETGNVVMISGALNIGDVVTVNYSIASTKIDAYGVCIGTSNGWSYVQVSGFLKADLVGLTPTSGDYIGVSNGRLVIVSSAEDGIGKAVIRQTVPFIYLYM